MCDPVSKYIAEELENVAAATMLDEGFSTWVEDVGEGLEHPADLLCTDGAPWIELVSLYRQPMSSEDVASLLRGRYMDGYLMQKLAKAGELVPA